MPTPPQQQRIRLTLEQQVLLCEHAAAKQKRSGCEHNITKLAAWATTQFNLPKLLSRTAARNALKRAVKITAVLKQQLSRKTIVSDALAVFDSQIMSKFNEMDGNVEAINDDVIKELAKTICEHTSAHHGRELVFSNGWLGRFM